MSPRLPVYKSADMVKLIEQAGFVFSRQKGSHMIFYRQGIRIIIPNHGKKNLHPKIVKEILEILSSSANVRRRGSDS